MSKTLIHGLGMCVALVFVSTGATSQDISDRRGGLDINDLSAFHAGTVGALRDDASLGYFSGYHGDFGSSVDGLGTGSAQALVDSEDVLRFKATEGTERGLGMYFGTAGLAVTESTPGHEADYFVGVGMDLRVNDYMSIGGEILYDDIGSIRSSTDNPVAASARITFSF